MTNTAHPAAQLRRIAAVVAAVVLTSTGCSDSQSSSTMPEAPAESAHTMASTPEAAPVVGPDSLVFYHAGNDDTEATIGVTSPRQNAAEPLATIPGNDTDKVVRYSKGFVAVGTKGLSLLSPSGAGTGHIDVADLNTLTGWTTSPSGRRTALALNTGTGRFPDAQTIVSIDSDSSTNFAVPTHSYPAALTQCDDGALKWLEPAPGQPPMGADTPVALDLVTATTPEQVKRIHLPAAPFPVFGAIDCSTNTASYLALSDSAETSTGVVIANPGPQATITRSTVAGSVSHRDTTGGIRTTTSFADQDGGMHQFGPDGILESWWFTPEGVTHEHVDTGLGGENLAGTTFTGDRAVIWHTAPNNHVNVQLIDLKKPECHSTPVQVPVFGNGQEITSMVPEEETPIDCAP